MRGIARRAALSTAVLGIVALGAGCAQLAGIEETTCSVRHAYACKCACTGGGESFSLNNDVCLPESLNPALNPDLLHKFVKAEGRAYNANRSHNREIVTDDFVGGAGKHVAA